MVRVRNCGVRRGVVLSSSARYGLLWLGLVRSSCPARLRNVRHGVIWRGLVWHRTVKPGPVWRCGVRQGFSLRGLAFYNTVLSCPVRLCKALFGKLFRAVVSHGGVGTGPVGSSAVGLGRVWHYHGLARSCRAGRGTVGRSFVWQGLALSWQGGVEQSEVRHGKLLFEVLFGLAGRSGVLQTKVFFRCGTVGSGFARLRAVGWGLLRHYLGFVRWSPARQGPVRLGVHGY